MTLVMTNCLALLPLYINPSRYKFMLGVAGHAGGVDLASGFGLDCAGPLFPTQL